MGGLRVPLRRACLGGVPRGAHPDLERVHRPAGGRRLRIPRGGARHALHHLVVRDGKIANYHPYAPTPWNGSVRDEHGTPGLYEDAVQNTPIFEENGPDAFKGIDIMRTVRSFDPCLPCGVHMVLGPGKVLETHYLPMFGREAEGR
jgi:Ni,Fe-hydrogenase I large subunit